MTLFRPVVLVLACTVALVWPAVNSGTSGVDAASMVPGVAASARDLWLAPDADHVVARQRLARAVGELADGRAAAALPTFTAAINDPTLGGYALLLAGRAQLALSRHRDAKIGRASCRERV